MWKLTWVLLLWLRHVLAFWHGLPQHGWAIGSLHIICLLHVWPQYLVRNFILSKYFIPSKGKGHSHSQIFFPSMISDLQILSFWQYNGHTDTSHLFPSNPSLHSHLNSWLPFRSEQYSVFTPMFLIMDHKLWYELNQMRLITKYKYP